VKVSSLGSRWLVISRYILEYPNDDVRHVRVNSDGTVKTKEFNFGNFNSRGNEHLRIDWIVRFFNERRMSLGVLNDAPSVSQQESGEENQAAVDGNCVQASSQIGAG
jgi:hypothetical protein